ncbi:flippase [Aeromonas veronii]
MYKSALINAVWLFLEKVIRMAVAFILTAKIASTLGPYEFGIIMYIQGIVSIFVAIASLGFDSYLVKEFSNKDSLHEKLSTAMIIRLSFSVMVFAVYNIFLQVILDNEIERVISFILSFTIIFQTQTVLFSFFQGIEKSKIIACCGIFSLLLTSCYKIYLILNDGTIEEFAISLSFDVAISFLGLCIYMLFSKADCFRILYFNEKYAKYLVKNTMPIALTAILIAVYSRFDQWYIANQLGYNYLGVYSIALRLVEAASFAPVALSVALIPLLSKNKDNNQFIKFYISIILLSSIVTFSLLNLASPVLISVLLDENYIEANALIPALSLSMTFSILGVVSTNYLIQINETKLRIPRIILGLLVNLTCNVLLVTDFGLIGAAMASIFGQFVASVLGNYFNTATRSFFFWQMRSIISLGVYDVYVYAKKTM